MAEIEITNFYWFNNPASNNDKVWGVFRIVEEGAFDRFYCFWGRRGSDIGKSLKFLKFGSEIPSNASKYDKDWYTREAKGEANSKAREKIKKGYVTVPDADIEKVYPGFRDHIFEQYIQEKLMSNIKNDG